MLSAALHGAIALAVVAAPSLLGGRMPVPAVFSVEIVMQPAEVPGPAPDVALVPPGAAASAEPAPEPLAPEAPPPSSPPTLSPPPPSPPTPVPRRPVVRAVSPARALAPPSRPRRPAPVAAALEARPETRPEEPLEEPAAPAVAATAGDATPVAVAAATPEPAAAAARSQPAGPPGLTREQALNAYSHALWQRIAARRPKGVHVRGTTLVAFSVAADGHLRAATIKRSSGNADLDRLALATIEAANPFPPPPVGLAAGPLSFAIPFDFR